MKWVGDITCIRTWEGLVYLATVPGCCTRKAVGYAIGATAHGTGPGVRGYRHGGPQVPDEEKEDDPPPQAAAASTPPPTPSSPTTWKTTVLPLQAGRTEVYWAGAWAEVGGCDPEDRESQR